MVDSDGSTPAPLTNLSKFPEFDLNFDIDVNTAPMTITVRPDETTDPAETAWLSSPVYHTVSMEETQ